MPSTPETLARLLRMNEHDIFCLISSRRERSLPRKIDAKNASEVYRTARLVPDSLRGEGSVQDPIQASGKIKGTLISRRKSYICHLISRSLSETMRLTYQE